VCAGARVRVHVQASTVHVQASAMHSPKDNNRAIVSFRFRSGEYIVCDFFKKSEELSVEK